MTTLLLRQTNNDVIILSGLSTLYHTATWTEGSIGPDRCQENSG